MYRRINIELAAIFKGGNNNSTIAKALEKLTEANITMRLKECLPQNSEFFRSGYKILNSNGTFSKQKDQKLTQQRKLNRLEDSARSRNGMKITMIYR